MLSVSGLPGCGCWNLPLTTHRGKAPICPIAALKTVSTIPAPTITLRFRRGKARRSPEALTFAAQYLGLNPQEGFCAGMLRGGMMTSAKLFVSQLQDWLEAEDVGRINTPGTAQGNWQFRLSPGVLSDELAAHIRAVAARYGRLRTAPH